MIIREGIEVTKIILDGYELPIPQGYSEFLLLAGYWGVGEKVERINREEILADYDRKVVVEDGKLCTILTYKGDK
ncbi:hypothetical protein [Bacillus sp. AY2-1]|uniref:hypothetical protein n=1 Tax=Bacillus sp. AY2-1 TaxID=2217828 RepID=UPI0011EC3E8F|nr:hypothetical protein [Bacillus sp. AY2-1]KAA0829009.1 hypothetical protein DN403_06955 [Bacillus sp. AY2-1]